MKNRKNNPFQLNHNRQLNNNQLTRNESVLLGQMQMLLLDTEPCDLFPHHLCLFLTKTDRQTDRLSQHSASIDSQSTYRQVLYRQPEYLFSSTHDGPEGLKTDTRWRHLSSFFKVYSIPRCRFITSRGHWAALSHQKQWLPELDVTSAAFTCQCVTIVGSESHQCTLSCRPVADWSKFFYHAAAAY